MASETCTVTIIDVELVVSYDYTPYRAATRLAPAEGGDIEITGIHLDGKSVDGMLAEWVMEKISAGIDADIAERRRQYAEDKALARAA